MEEAKLYVIPGSHPSRSAMLMLDRKGIPFKRVDLMPVDLQGGPASAQRLPGRHRPGPEARRQADAGLDARSAGSSTASSPSRRSIPADPEQRGKVEEAEAWGDEFQQKPRRISWWAFKRRSLADGELLGGRAARRPSRARGQDRRADRRDRRPG